MKNNVMTTTQFKNTFKVGDKICGFCMNNIYTITAIGEKRFLYVDYRGVERVGMIYNHQARWRVVKPPELKIDSSHTFTTINRES